MSEKKVLERVDLFSLGKNNLEDCEIQNVLSWFSAKGKKRPELIVYKHEYGGYDGWGMMVVLSDGRWYTHDTGHCSCYGPTDHFEPNPDGFSSLWDLCKASSGDYRNQLSDVIEELLKLGYDNQPPSKDIP